MTVDTKDLKKKAEQGDTKSAKSLALMYEIGLEVQSDMSAALENWNRAAEGDDVEAMKSLEFIYANGPEEIRNPDKAAKMKEKLNQLGYKSTSEVLANFKQAVSGTKRILIIDDNDEQCKLVKRAVDSLDLGITVFTASNGMNGLKQLIDAKGMDLIIVDLMMPQMDGLEFVKVIRRLIHHRIPVMVMTGNQPEKVDQNQIKTLKIDHVIHKPFETSDFKTKITKMLEVS